MKDGNYFRVAIDNVNEKVLSLFDEKIRQKGLHNLYEPYGFEIEGIWNSSCSRIEQFRVVYFFENYEIVDEELTDNEKAILSDYLKNNFDRCIDNACINCGDEEWLELELLKNKCLSGIPKERHKEIIEKALDCLSENCDYEELYETLKNKLTMNGDEINELIKSDEEESPSMNM